VWSGQLEKALRILAEKLCQEGKLNPDKGWIDRSFRGCEKGGLAVGKTKRGKRTKFIAIAPGNSVSPAVTIDSASPHESKLVGAAVRLAALVPQASCPLRISC
jgi:hypothetical protein